MTAFLKGYRFFSRLAGPALKYHLKNRLLKGKESPNRVSERYGYASCKRPKGALVWVHAASVGETLSAVSFLKKLHQSYPQAQILLTTGTVTAYQVFQQISLKNTIHQFCVLDVPDWVQRFLDHWQPNAAIFIEQELWPNLITETKARGIPLLLLNARISAKTFRLWSWFPTSARRILCAFDQCFAQSEETSQFLKKLGAPQAHYLGNLKFAATPLTYDPQEYKTLHSQLSTRPIWVAASTHPGEEQQIAQAHREIQKVHPKVLTVLIPRHPARRSAIFEAIQQPGSPPLKVSLRSRKQGIQQDTEIYLVDTIGELGLFYKLAPVVFMGGTLVPHGGHNPIEPALFRCSVVWGPHMENFQDVCHVLKECCTFVSTPSQLATFLIDAFHQPDKTALLAKKTYTCVQTQATVVDVIFSAVRPTLKKALVA